MDAKTDELITEFVLDGNDFRDWALSYSIAPTNTIPIIRQRTHADTGEVSRIVEAAAWDFHPSYMKYSKRPQFNARLETVASNGLWKSAFASPVGRCIVPIRGYYEWTGEPESKQPWFIHNAAGQLLAAAGVATARKVEDTWEVSAAVITTEGRDASGEVHDRMPVFLAPEVRDRWLDPQKLEDWPAREEMVALLENTGRRMAAQLTTYHVDRRLNSTRTVDPSDAGLIEPLAGDVAHE